MISLHCNENYVDGYNKTLGSQHSTATFTYSIHIPARKRANVELWQRCNDKIRLYVCPSCLLHAWFNRVYLHIFDCRRRVHATFKSKGWGRAAYTRVYPQYSPEWRYFALRSYSRVEWFLQLPHNIRRWTTRLESGAMEPKYILDEYDTCHATRRDWIGANLNAARLTRHVTAKWNKTTKYG